MNSTLQHQRGPAVHSWLLLLALLTLCQALPAAAENIRPFPPGIIVGDKLHEWSFDNGLQGWHPTHDCRLSASAGVLKIVSTGTDPYLAARVDVSAPIVAARLRARCASDSARRACSMARSAVTVM